MDKQLSHHHSLNIHVPPQIHTVNLDPVSCAIICSDLFLGTPSHSIGLSVLVQYVLIRGRIHFPTLFITQITLAVIGSLLLFFCVKLRHSLSDFSMRSPV